MSVAFRHALSFCQCFRFHMGRVRSLHCSMRRVRVGKLPCISYRERPMIKPSIALSLFYVSKALFHPMLDCIGSSLGSLVPDTMCTSVWNPLLGLVTGTWCSVGQAQTKGILTIRIFSWVKHSYCSLLLLIPFPLLIKFLPGCFLKYLTRWIRI